MKRESTEKLQEERQDTVEKLPTKKQRLESKKEEEVVAEIFADPTYDITFKMLFGSDKNKDVLISLLNSLLGFKGEKEIKDVEINNTALPVIPFSTDKSKLGVSSTVDVLCTTLNGQKIAIEMQGQKTKYFLAREQEYMAKLLIGQVKEGEGKKYHEKVLETYIVIITKENVFTGKSEFEKKKLFEIDVEPRIVQTNESYPDNKMHWKFFELAKFKSSSNYSKITKDSNLKEQWLEFLIECNKQLTEPERNEIIKQGYEIMKIAKWGPDIQAAYWKQKQDVEDILQEQEDLIEETKQKAFQKGKLKGEIKGEIGKIKIALGEKWENEKVDKKVVKKLKHTHEKFQDIKEYFEKNPNQLTEDDNESVIIGELGLLDDYS